MFTTMVLIRMLYGMQLLQVLVPRFFCRLFRLSKDACSLLICALFLGFPSASQFLDAQCHRANVSEPAAKRLLYTCCFPTCSFVILTCGSVFFHSLSYGFLLYGAQVLSGLLLLWCTRSQSIELTLPRSQSTPKVSLSLFASAIKESGIALYMIGGYLMLFMSVCGVMLQLLPDMAALPLRIVTEFSSGCALLQELSLSPLCKLLLTSALLGFGGFCVHIQIFSMVAHTKLSYPTFLFFRLLQALFAASLFFLIFICAKI